MKVLDARCEGYLNRIDNWKNYKQIRKIEKIIQDYNSTVAPEYEKEETRRKLLNIQQYLLNIIFEISSILPERD